MGKLYNAAFAKWYSARYDDIVTTIRALDCTSKREKRLTLTLASSIARYARRIWDLFVYTGNIEPERWSPGGKKVRVPQKPTAFYKNLEDTLNLRPGNTGSLLFDENTRPRAPRRMADLPEGHDVSPKKDSADIEIEVDDFDAVLQRETKKPGMVIDIYTIGIKKRGHSACVRSLPSERRKKKFYGEEGIRMLRETNFFVTVNTNRPVPNETTQKKWSEIFSRALYDLFQEYRNWLVCVKENRKDILEIERYIDTCNIVGGIEVGGVHHTLHAHFLVHMLHYTKLQLLFSNVRSFIRNRFAKVRLWDEELDEPWFSTARMRCFFSRALQNKSIKKCKALEYFRKPEWQKLVPETVSPTRKERQHLQIAMRRGYLRFYEDDEDMHIHSVLMPPVGWTSVILAYIFKKGDDLERELRFVRWNDVIRQEHLFHVFKQRSLPLDFAPEDDADVAPDLIAAEEELL